MARGVAFPWKSRSPRNFSILGVSRQIPRKRLRSRTHRCVQDGLALAFVAVSPRPRNTDERTDGRDGPVELSANHSKAD